MTKLSCKIRIQRKVKVKGHWFDSDISDEYPTLIKELNEIYQSGGKLPKIGTQILPDMILVRKHSDNNNIYLVVE